MPREFEWRTNIEADVLSGTTPEGIRRSLLKKVDISKTLLTKALRETEAALDANEVRVFAHKGVPISSKVYPDRRTRLAASDQVYRIAGVYQREEDKVSDKPEIMVQVNEKGVVSIRVGPPVRKEVSDGVVESEESTLALAEAKVDQMELFKERPPDQSSQRVELEPEIETVKYEGPTPTPIPNLGNRTTPGIPGYIRKIIMQK